MMTKIVNQTARMIGNKLFTLLTLLTEITVINLEDIFAYISPRTVLRWTKLGRWTACQQKSGPIEFSVSDTYSRGDTFLVNWI